MDGQQFDNGQNGQNGQSGQDTRNSSMPQDNYYQDYTANMQYQAPRPEKEPATTNGLQIAALVLGILGIPACCCYGVPGVIFGIIGIVLAVVGNKRGTTGIGIAGLVCSIIALIFGIAGTIYYAAIIAAMFSGTGPFAELLQDPAYQEMLEEMGYPNYN